MPNFRRRIPYLEENEKVGVKGFSHFLEFPSELRMMLVDKMEADDRCRFSGSSTKCYNEAKASKNYIYGLELSFSEVPSINIIHGIVENSEKGMELTFSNNNKVICKNLCGKKKVLWETRVKGSKNVENRQTALDQFEWLLENFQSRIKKLRIEVLDSGSFPLSFEINNFNNLEQLRVETKKAPLAKIDIYGFLSKTRKNLKNLEILGDVDGRLLGDCEEMYQVQQEIHSRKTQLAYDQFLRLSAPKVSINIGSLTENDIYNLVRRWQNEKFGENMK